MSAVIHTAPAKLAHHRRQDLEIFSFFFFPRFIAFFSFSTFGHSLSSSVKSPHIRYISHRIFGLELSCSMIENFLFFFFPISPSFLTHSLNFSRLQLTTGRHSRKSHSNLRAPQSSHTTATILHSHRLFSFKTRDTRSCLVFFQPFFTNFFPADRKTLGRKRGKKTTSPTHQKPFLFSVSLLLCLRLSRKKLVKNFTKSLRDRIDR